jgi:hypothetical protein
VVERRACVAAAAERHHVMQHRAIHIEDEIHCEQDGPYESVKTAIAELCRRAAIAWDLPPNQALCASWRKCGRHYPVLEFDNRTMPCRLVRDVHVLDISPKGVSWVEGFEQKWSAGAA